MSRTLWTTALLLLPLSFGHCQAPAPAAFEAASITPCKPGTPEPPGEHAGMVQFTFPGGRFHATATTLKYLLEWAYDIQAAQHSDGPAWLSTDRYEIEATAGTNVSDAQMKRMVQALIEQRFHLKMHRETKEMQAIVLAKGKSAPKVSPVKADEIHAIRFTPQNGSDGRVAAYHILCSRFTVAQLSDVFSRPLGQVIVDQTGLEGEFDFTVDLTPDESRPTPLDPAMLLSALRDQIGLSVKSQKTPVEFLVIDNVEKVMAGN